MPPLLRMIIASAALGAVIGLIRQWNEQKSDAADADFGGVRTHTLWALLGCLGASAREWQALWVLPVVLAAIATHLIAFRAPGGEQAGSTTLAAALLTVLVGALVAWGAGEAAIVVAGITVLLGGLKQPIHAWTRQFTPKDIRATLQFVAITGVILPLVPNQDLGPRGAFNPYETWLMVVLISGLGFGGYIAVRLLGSRRGVLLSSLFGGLASSTATTLAFSRRSRDQPQLSGPCSLAVAVASAVMLVRVFVLVHLLSAALAQHLLPALGLMALPAIIYSIWQWFREERETRKAGSLDIANPLELGIAIKFAALYAAVAFAVKVISEEGLQGFLLPVSFASGLTDMAAVSLSLARNHVTGNVDLTLASRAILLAAVSNSLVKGGIALHQGSPQLKRHAAVVFAVTILCAGAGWWMV